MEKQKVIEGIILTYKCQTRIKIASFPDVTSWSQWFIIPTSGYVELSPCGPIPINEIEWVEINPIVTVRIGRLVPDKHLNHLESIIAVLKANDIQFDILDGLIKIQ